VLALSSGELAALSLLVVTIVVAVLRRGAGLRETR
jgi:hypothetical protein